MAENKYDKNFIFETGASPLHPKAGFPWIPLMRIDQNYMKEGFYYECVWITGTITGNQASKPHSHDCEEYLGFFGNDVTDPTNLNAEVEFWLDEEKHIFTRNCVVYVPAGVWHTPIFIRNLKKPVFCFSACPVIKYEQKINTDPKWAHLQDPPEMQK